MKMASSPSSQVGSKGQIDLMNLDHCPSCHSTKRKPFLSLPNVAVYTCVFCGLRYLDPCLSPSSMVHVYASDETLTSLHRCHEGYYDYGDLATSNKTSRDFQRALQLLEQHLPSARRTIFDVGFGNGYFLSHAKARGWQVGGIDSSTRNAELAKKKFGLELSISNFESYEPEQSLYDVVSFWDVIEHLPDPHQFISKAQKMLRPNGFILIALPNDRSLLSVLSIFLYHISFSLGKKGTEKIYILEHVAYYDLGTLTGLLKQHHFTLCDHFLTNTDLARYTLSWSDRLIGDGILGLGSLFGFQNRLVAVFRMS